MPRKTLIFGNGLGMALDHEHFSLARALEDVWAHPRHVPDIQKRMISRCIDNDGRAPNGEEQLDTLHLIVASCNTINSIGDDEVHWLTREGQDFPTAVAKYIHRVASDLHLYDGRLPSRFLTPLFEFLRNTQSNIATLNYDRLLYGALVDEGILAGYNGDLVDGMLDAGFSEDNLVRMYGNRFGYYLHLHGSPLFYDDHHGMARKMTRDQLDMSSARISNHIVLDHVRHKRSVIGSSYVLSTYWDYLSACCHEAQEIIVFGYSGLDTHLNEVLAAYAQSKSVRVVEWQGAGSPANRERFWRGILKTDEFDLDHLDNILTFSDW